MDIEFTQKKLDFNQILNNFNFDLDVIETDFE